MKKLKIFTVTILLSMFYITGFADEVDLTDQIISDVYVDDGGNLAFGVRVMGDIERDYEAIALNGMAHRPGHIGKPTIEELKYLCVWNIGSNKINDLRFKYTGTDKQAVLSLLLLARMRNEKISITYTPGALCTESDLTQCECSMFADLVDASFIKARDDIDTKSASVSSTTDVTSNDIFLSDSTFSVTGGTCSDRTPLSPATNTTGILGYTSPTSGNSCTVIYEVCGPVPYDALCDTATLDVTVP